MRKNIFLILSVIFVFAILVMVVFIFLYNQKPQGLPQDISKVSDNQIISLLEKNPDAKDYMQSYKDFKIEKKEVLTKESIVAGQNGPNFKEVYQDLKLENNRYMRIDLMNQAGDKGLITVIDFNEKTAPRAYGIMLFKASTNQNGQETSPTENK